MGNGVSLYRDATEMFHPRWGNGLMCSTVLPSLATATVVLTANSAYGVALTAPKSGTITAVSCYVVTTSAGNIQFGVYSDDATTLSLIDASAAAAVGSSGSWQTFTGMSAAVVAGNTYHLVVASDATPTLMRSPGMAAAAHATLPSDFAPNIACKKYVWIMATSYALPATFTVASLTANTAVPLMLAQIT